MRERRPQANFRHHHQQNSRRHEGDQKIHQRSGECNANVAFPILRAGLGLPFALIEHRNAADRQQYDGFGWNAGVRSHQRVSQFVQHHRAENNPDERQAASRIYRIVRGLGKQDKQQQKQERQVNAQFHPENSARRN